MIHSPNQNYQLYKQYLHDNAVFQIGLKEPNITKENLALVYTPGVGEVCKEIYKTPQLFYSLTNRNNSVAVISNGDFLNVKGVASLPILQWLCMQIKYYSGIDAYPVVIEKNVDMRQVINDIGGSMCGVVSMQQNEVKDIDEDILYVSQSMIIRVIKRHKLGLSLSQGMYTGFLLKVLLNNKILGIPSQNQLQSYLNDLDEQNTWKKINMNVNQQNYVDISIQNRRYYEDKNRLFQQYTNRENAIYIHRLFQGKMFLKLNFKNIDLLKSLFTYKNISKLILQINQQQKMARVYTSKKNLCAIITDGTAILGLGNIGPRAGLPVMQGKSCLFKHLGGVDVIPICIKPKTPKQQIKAIKNLSVGFAAINLEDIKAPICFQVQQGLKKQMNIPIFHDDQHGTAIVVLAGLINASKVAQRPLSQSKIVINGAGAAGLTICQLLHFHGVKQIIVCDTKGSIYSQRKQNMNFYKDKIAQFTNPRNIKGLLSDCLEQADVFVGVSNAGALKRQWVPKMAKKAIIFALANPTPQILPNEALQEGAFIVATGRSDFNNQINNSLVFPGIFKGILQSRMSDITMQTKQATSLAIAKSIQKWISRDRIIPQSLNRDVANLISIEINKLMNIK